jgi:hypothetical protein
MIVSFFDGCDDNTPNRCDWSFEDLTEVLAFASTVPQKREAKESVMCVVPADFEPCRRASDNAIRYAFTGDVDGDKPGDLGFAGTVSLLSSLGLAFIAHTTTKSTLHTNRYRVILPFSEPLARADYEAVWDSINQMLGDIFDTKTFDAGRLSIVPCAWYGAPAGYSPLTPWDEADSHHGYAACAYGSPIDAEGLLEVCPPRLRATADSFAPQIAEIAEILAASPPLSDFDYHQLVDLDRSPLVRAEAIADYLSAPPGGRYFSFLCAVANTAIRQRLPCDETVIHALGLAMNARGQDRKRRSIREVRRAINFVAGHQIQRTPTKEEQREAMVAASIIKLTRAKRVKTEN